MSENYQKIDLHGPQVDIAKLVDFFLQIYKSIFQQQVNNNLCIDVVSDSVEQGAVRHTHRCLTYLRYILQG